MRGNGYFAIAVCKEDLLSQKMAVDSKSSFVSDLGAGPQQEIRPEQIENAVGFLSHPKVRYPFETMIKYSWKMLVR